MNRAALLRRAAGASVLLGALPLARPAHAATVPDGDLAYLRLLVAAELLKGELEARAAGGLRAAAARVVRRMHADDSTHYAALAALMSDAGQPPATAADIDFAYPRGSFASERSIVALAARVATLTLGAYLGALQDVQTPALRLPLGQIAANEAQHVSALEQLRGRPAIGAAFARSLRIDAASAALGEYES
jgi:hypothetical protein